MNMMVRPDFLLEDVPTKFRDEDWRRLLLHGERIGVSDLIVRSATPVVGFINGRMVSITKRRVESTEVADFINMMYGGRNGDVLVRQGKPIDNAYRVRVSRDRTIGYRWNATGIRGETEDGIRVTLRLLPEKPPKLLPGELPERLWKALRPKDGLIMVCGETGQGKTTLLASIIREIAESPEANANILTFEDPIEFTYDKIEMPACIISQSQVPDHVESFAEGVRNSLRSKPTHILVGESRDAETIKASVLAAQTGHALYTTLHANNVASTFLRVIQTIPESEQQSLMGSLLDSVRVILCQQLVPSTDGKRVPIREWLVIDADMRRELLKTAVNTIGLLPAVAADMVKQYGVTKLQHAEELWALGRITEREVELIRATYGGH